MGLTGAHSRKDRAATQQWIPCTNKHRRKQRNLPSEPEHEKIRELGLMYLEGVTAHHPLMDYMLWPRLLFFLVLSEYTAIFTPLCKSLTVLALRNQQVPDNKQIDYCPKYRMENRPKVCTLPSPCAMLVRLLVISSSPHEDQERAVAALELLSALHKSVLFDLWPHVDINIPLMVKYLEGKSGSTLDVREWSDMLLEFYFKTLDYIRHNACVSLLGKEFYAQMNYYSGKSTEKNFLYKCIGVTLTVCEDTLEVENLLRDTFQRASFTEESEREGITEMVRRCAEAHLTLTLDVLDQFTTAINEPDAGAVSFLQDLPVKRADNIRSTLMMIWGAVAVHAGKTIPLTRVGVMVAVKVLQLYQNNQQTLQNLTLALSFLKSVSLICTAVLDNDCSSVFFFPKKTVHICLILDLIDAEPEETVSSPVRYQAITALKNLSKLRPSLEQQAIDNIIHISVKSILCLPPLKVMTAEETPADSENIKMLYELSMESLGKLLISFLEASLDQDNLNRILDCMKIWIVSNNKWEKERAIKISSQLLAVYDKGFFPNGPSKFENAGCFLALFAPCLLDSMDSIRKYSLECIYHLVRLQCLYQGRSDARELDDISAARYNIKHAAEMLRDPDDSCVAPCNENISTLTRNIAEYISKYVSVAEFVNFVETTFERLLSKDGTCAEAAAELLRSGIDVMVHRLQDHDAVLMITELVLVFDSKLHLVKNAGVKEIVLGAIQLVALSHKDIAIKRLLMLPLPLQRNTSDLWRALSKGRVLSDVTLRLLMDILLKNNEFMDSSESDVSLERMKIICAMKEVLDGLNTQNVTDQLFSDLFCMLLAEVSQRLGQGSETSTSSDTFNICSLAVDALRSLLSTEQTRLHARLNIEDKGVWSLLQSIEGHHEGVMMLTRALLGSGILTSYIIDHLLPSLQSESMPWRVAVMAVFAEMMGHQVLKGKKLTKMLIKHMKRSINEDNVTMCFLAIRALHNVSTHAPDKLKKYNKHILEPIWDAVCNITDCRILKECFKALIIIVYHLKRKDLGVVFESMSLKCTKYMDDQDKEIRENAMWLFGWLAKSAKVNSKSSFADHARGHLNTILWRLNDPCIAVSKASDFALHSCAPFLGCRGIENVLKRYPSIAECNYVDFLREVSVYLTNPEEFISILERGSAHPLPGHSGISKLNQDTQPVALDKKKSKKTKILEKFIVRKPKDSAPPSH